MSKTKIGLLLKDIRFPVSTETFIITGYDSLHKEYQIHYVNGAFYASCHQRYLFEEFQPILNYNSIWNEICATK
jgi:hypothetical protein